jgi:SAM-dependent methyltransferase
VVTAQQADIRQLPFPDEQFDAVICFETLEHIEMGDAALSELRRVLRPNGFVLASSPNRGVYPGGNEFHVHEYSADELLAAAQRLFRNVRPYRQHAWVASSLEPVTDQRGAPELHWRRTLRPGEEIFTLVAASNGALPDLGTLVGLGDAFEVRWWEEQVRAAAARADELELRELREAEQERAAHAETAERLRRTGRQLLEVEQQLAKLPTLMQRINELERQHEETLARTAETLRQMRAGYETSLSWRLTAPLRTARRARR